MATFIDILETPTAGQNGFIAASSSPVRTHVRLVDANINSGLFVTEGATPGTTCKAPTTAAEARACIGCLINPEILNDVNAAADYLSGQAATILEHGYIWVNAEATVAVGDKVYVRHTSDGGSNTTRGTVRNNADGTVVIDTAGASEGRYVIGLNNGLVDEFFTYQTDGSVSNAEVIAGLVTAINASANYNAAGTTEITVTRVTGTEINVIHLEGPTATGTDGGSVLWSVVDNQKAARLKGAYFASAVSGAGLAKVRLQLRQD
jgi:hypothetical protein